MTVYILPEERHSGEFDDNIRALKNIVNKLDSIRENNVLIAMGGSPIEDRRDRI